MDSSPPTLGSGSDRPPKSISDTGWYFWKLLAIILVLSAGYFAWLVYQAGKSLREFGKPQIHLFGSAKALIHDQTHLDPSPKATAFYDYQDGFIDPNLLISYSDTPEALAQTVQSMTGKAIGELPTFHPEQADYDKHLYYQKDNPSHSITVLEPGWGGKENEQYHTPFFDLSSVTDGKYFYHADDKSEESWVLIIDTKKNRLYFFEAE